VPVGHRPRSIGFLPDGSRAFVSLENDGAIAVVDAQAHKFLHLIQLTGEGKTPKSRPMGVLVPPDGSTVLVTTGSFGKLFFVNPVEKKATDASIEVGTRPWGLGLTPDGKTIYIANGPSNDVSVVDLATKTVVKKIAVGNRPWGIAVVSK
jgi:YVTN family beta-propeller protein